VPRVAVCRAGTAALVVAGALLAAGCPSAPHAVLPKTYPAKGKVVYKDNKPMSGGMVQFRSEAAAAFTITGEVQQDGTFRLTTMEVQGTKADGAPEGQYEVTVMPLMNPDQSGGVPVTLPKPYTIKPGEGNDIVIQLDQPSPR
jgi:hypothetical protein